MRKACLLVDDGDDEYRGANRPRILPLLLPLLLWSAPWANRRDEEADLAFDNDMEETFCWRCCNRDFLMFFLFLDYFICVVCACRDRNLAWCEWILWVKELKHSRTRRHLSLVGLEVSILWKREHFHHVLRNEHRMSSKFSFIYCSHVSLFNSHHHI